MAVACVSVVALVSCGADETSGRRSGTSSATVEGGTTTTTELPVAAATDTGSRSLEDGCGAGSLEQVSVVEFATELTASIAAEGSNEFVRIVASGGTRQLERALGALMTDETGAAKCQLVALEERGVRYEIVELVDATGPGVTYAMREAIPIDHIDYKGWGTLLVRPSAPGARIYQAPHPTADWQTEQITLDAFMRDDEARVALFAGTHRYANGDLDGDGESDSDATHDTETLFHELTRVFIDRGLSTRSPYWIIQIHGSRNRDVAPDTSEPTIVGSDGADLPELSTASPLVQADAAVAASSRPVSMGVCGWDEDQTTVDEKGNPVELTGQYTLCATGNVQGDLLEARGLRETFMHLEIERSARESYEAGSGAGYQSIVDLVDAIASLPPPSSP